MKDPLWRIVLNWGAVVTFFSAPLFVFVLQILDYKMEWIRVDIIDHFRWMGGFYASVTALVFGLAGLNSFDRRTNGKTESPKANGK